MIAFLSFHILEGNIQKDEVEAPDKSWRRNRQVIKIINTLVVNGIAFNSCFAKLPLCDGK